MTRPSLHAVLNYRQLVLLGIILLASLFWLNRAIYQPNLKSIASLQQNTEKLLAEQKALLQFEQAVQQKPQLPSAPSQSTLSLLILQGEREAGIPSLGHLLGLLTAPYFLSDIQLESIKYDPIQEQADYRSTVLHAQMRGSFSELLNYLARLEQLDALFHVQNFNLVPVPENPKELRLEWSADYYELGELS